MTVLCSFPAIASTALQIGGDFLGQKAQAKAAQAQMDAQAKAAVTQMNYAFQNYEQERTDAFDAAVSEIEKIRLQSMQLNSQVKNAVNEKQEGRTARAIIRSTEGDTARAVSSVQSNFKQQSNEIDLNKEAVLKSTRNTLLSINASAPKMPSAFSNLLSYGGIALGNFTATQNLKNDVLSKGMEWDWWKGGAKPTSNPTFKNLTLYGDYGFDAQPRNEWGYSDKYGKRNGLNKLTLFGNY